LLLRLELEMSRITFTLFLKLMQSTVAIDVLPSHK
jgi:hypothetical protein